MTGPRQDPQFSSRPKSKQVVACVRGATSLKKLKLNIGYAPCGSSNLAVILAADWRRSGMSARSGGS